MPGSLPLPFPEHEAPSSAPVDADRTSTAEAGPAEPAAPDDEPGHRRGGLLFESDAWDDPTVPPAPPGGGGG
jgi:hypothetical protein